MHSKRNKRKIPNIDWRGIAGFRDVIVHSYFKINLLIVLKEDIERILKDLNK